MYSHGLTIALAVNHDDMLLHSSECVCLITVDMFLT